MQVRATATLQARDVAALQVHDAATLQAHAAIMLQPCCSTRRGSAAIVCVVGALL
jgi:hypothetical protein